MAAKKQTYESAVQELEVILNEIESGELSVDQLTDKVKKASQLIKFCKQKLYSTEQDVEKILEELDEE